MYIFFKTYIGRLNDIRLDVMTGVRTPVPPLCVCEFMMVLSSRLSTKKKISWDLKKRSFSLGWAQF